MAKPNFQYEKRQKELEKKKKKEEKLQRKLERKNAGPDTAGPDAAEPQPPSGSSEDTDTPAPPDADTAG